MRGLGRKVASATDVVVLLGGLLAAIPVLVATVHALDVGWTASSDDGMIALRSFDVLSTHPPLVGQYSQSSPLIHEATYSLGPMLYWLLALPAHVGPRALPLAMGAVNAAAVVGSVLLAGRRGGRPLALITAFVLALTVRALPVEAGYEIWNCWAGLFPFAFLLFLAWSVACGDHRLLPLLAVTASYMAQIHFTYLVPTVAACAVAVGGLALYRRSQPAGGLRAWVVAALVLGVVCWTPPLADQAIHRPGNMVLAYRLASDDHETAGTKAGREVVTRAIGVVPWWAKRARTPTERVAEPLLGAPVIATVSAAALTAALVPLLLLAVRRRRHDLATALALALLMILSMFVVATALPGGSLGLAALAYVLVWTVLAGMWVWLVAGWTAWSLLAGGSLAAVRRRLEARGTALAAALAVGAAAVLVAAGRDYDDPQRFPPGLKDYRMVEATAEYVADHLDGSKGVVLDVPIEVRNSLTFQSAIAYALRRKGLPIAAPRRLSREMGPKYQVGPGPFDTLVIVRNSDEPDLPSTRTILRNRAVSVMLKAWNPSTSRSSAR